MRKPAYTKQFEKDIKKLIKSGKDRERIKKVLTALIKEENLELKYRDHKLIGKFKDRRECHIETDWLLIYKIFSDEIIFERTGSHSELFK
ncbi:MAG: type II toxin-antitoxin system YafQ family toxin [Armatimonadetes bacterium]|nr:type II toxin-antitoxin system YafQ family toxin [Armatimonadota bacterium]